MYVLGVVVVIGGIVLVIVFRKPLWAKIKGLRKQADKPGESQE